MQHAPRPLYARLPIDQRTLPRFTELFAALDDLLKRIADSDDPLIRRKRARLRVELLALQQRLDNGSGSNGSGS